MAEKKQSRKLQFLVFGLISLIAIAACAVVLVITVRTIENETSSSVEYDTQSKTQLSDDPFTLITYLHNVTSSAMYNQFIKANIYTDVSVNDGTIAVSDTSGTQLDADRNLLIYTKNKIISTVDSYYPEDVTGVFGSFTYGMPHLNISLDEIERVTFSTGEADEEGNPVYNNDTGELIDADYYFITVYLKPSNETYSTETADKFTTDIASLCLINDSNVELTQNVIRAKINRITDEIDTITFDKVYAVNADVTFRGDLSVFADRKISFEYKTSRRCEYSYAGISFAESTATVEPGNEIALSVNAVIENDSEYTVTFTSSDPNVATVDEMGYVKGIKASCVPVTITVTLEYLGEKFTDECTVTVNDDNNPNG
ncbi:MAG: Ig-like domain-containing protein [Clostridia bacterium]|nr:Ig-like domain-containing protein [Clostridia bacterium]